MAAPTIASTMAGACLGPRVRSASTSSSATQPQVTTGSPTVTGTPSAVTATKVPPAWCSRRSKSSTADPAGTSVTPSTSTDRPPAGDRRTARWPDSTTASPPPQALSPELAATTRSQVANEVTSQGPTRRRHVKKRGRSGRLVPRGCVIVGASVGRVSGSSGHMHVPAAQVWPVGQWLSQAPQLDESVWGLTQLVPHCSRFAPQLSTHMAARQS